MWYVEVARFSPRHKSWKGSVTGPSPFGHLRTEQEAQARAEWLAQEYARGLKNGGKYPQAEVVLVTFVTYEAARDFVGELTPKEFAALTPFRRYI